MKGVVSALCTMPDDKLLFSEIPKYASRGALGFFTSMDSCVMMLTNLIRNLVSKTVKDTIDRELPKMIQKRVDKHFDDLEENLSQLSGRKVQLVRFANENVLAAINTNDNPELIMVNIQQQEAQLEKAAKALADYQILFDARTNWLFVDNKSDEVKESSS